MVRIPLKIPLGEAIALYAGVDGDLLVAVGEILPCGLRGGVHVAGLDGLRLLGPIRQVQDLRAAEIPHGALDCHVFQRHRAADAGGHDQVSGNGHVPEGRPLRGVDHHRALHVPGVGDIGLDQRLDHVVQDRHDLRPGDGLRGAEVAVRGVGDVPSGGHLRQIGQRVAGHLLRVQIVDRGGLAGDVKGPADHGDRLLAGDGVPGQSRAVVAQIDAGGMELQDGVLPIVPVQVGKRPGRGDGLEFQEAVQDAREGAPGDGVVRPEGAVVIAADDAVLLAPLGDGRLRPMARGIGKGCLGRQCQRAHCHRQRQQRRCDLFSRHVPLPFPCFRHDASQKNPAVIRWDIVIGLHITTARRLLSMSAEQKARLYKFFFQVNNGSRLARVMGERS